jgi:DNA helicase-2/ATP-dependent DNA helicase PcrA
VRSGVRFFEAAHVKDVLAHLRFVHNPGDELALKRVLRLAPGIGSMTADAVWGALVERRRGGGGTVDDLLAAEVGRHVPPKGREGYARTAGLLREISRPPTRDLPGESIDRVIDGGYEEYLRTAFVNAESRVEDVRQLADYARGYDDTEAFLSEIALLTEITAETVAEGSEEDEKMVLSSVHQAKGLEWRAVFVVWLADGRFPSAQALRDPDGEEEERRLFYVASTRAKDELTLCYPVVSAPRDRERIVLKASRFLEELPGEPPVYERWQLEDPGGTPALGPAAAAVLPAMAMPRLFGEAPAEVPGPASGERPGAAPRPRPRMALVAPAGGRDAERGDGAADGEAAGDRGEREAGEGDGVPF